jgi:hypothetical protein
MQEREREKVEACPEYETKHFTVDQVAAMWMLSADVVRRLFENEPGVVVIRSTGGKIRRSYRTLRIPASVVDRVHKRLAA